MPEKSITDIPRNLRDQFEKGTAALQQNNLDYALSLFVAVLKAEPAFFACRDALRKTQLKRAGAATGGLFKKMLGAAGSSPLLAKAKMQLGKNPVDAMATAEDILNGDPRNASAHRIIASAAAALGFPRTAVLSLETLWAASPGDKEVGVALANAYMGAGLAQKAEDIFQELVDAYPNDPELAMAYKNFSASRTMDEKGYEALATGKGSYRDILKDKEEAVSLEQGNRAVKDEDLTLKLIKEYEARLQNEPQNMKLARDIAELYTQKKQYDRALEYYQYMIAAGGAGGDSSLEKAVTEVTLRKLDQEIAALDAAAPDYAAQKERLLAERAAYQLADVQRRVERYPTDLQIRFELGVLHFNAGRIDEAIQEFQKARGNQNRRIQAMNYLGQCFARHGMNEMAARQFTDAIKEKQLFDEEKKELVYNLGCVLEKMGKTQEALREFEQIYQEDIGYRDVKAKVIKLGSYGSGGQV